MSVMIDRLQQLLDPQGAQAEPSVPTEAQVDAATAQAEAVMTKLAPVDLSAEAVENFAGKTSVQSIGLLLDTAQALRQNPEVAKATSVSADEAEGAARLMIAAGGLQGGFAALNEGFDAAALLCTRDIDGAIQTALDRSEEIAQSPDKEFVLRSLFGEAARLRQGALAPQAAVEPQPNQQIERRRRVNDLLDDIKGRRLVLRDGAVDLVGGGR